MADLISTYTSIIAKHRASGKHESADETAVAKQVRGPVGAGAHDSPLRRQSLRHGKPCHLPLHKGGFAGES